MSDVNKTTHTGVAITNPSFTMLSANTPMTIFTLKVRESWVNRSGTKQHRDNLLKIEVLGKNAYWARDHVKAGKRFLIDGYVRTDILNGVEEVRIRSFNISEEDDGLFMDGKREGYKEGLLQCFALLNNSDSLSIVKSKIEVLLAER